MNKKKSRKIKQQKNKDESRSGVQQISDTTKHAKRLEQAMSLSEQLDVKAKLKENNIGGFRDILFEWVEDGMRRTGRVQIAEIDKQMDQTLHDDYRRFPEVWIRNGKE